ncbi:MAG: C45 family autoproteolytic acyltransferase/hydrolase [Planctomycetota bacterium]|nr:C45 family autoproteolytic acyltransferase/hydrolase [Planctomycetota bacterium]
MGRARGLESPVPAGTPEEMGGQYGRLMRPALQALSSYARCVLSAERLERFLEYGRRHERVLPEEIRRQLRAMAGAGGIDYDQLVAMNVTPRLLCSALATWGPATPDGAMILGRNGDYFGLGVDDCGNLLVAYHPTAGRPVLLVSFLGMAGGFAGMNDAGVAFGNLLVFNSSGWRDDGLPVQLAMRLAAQTAPTAPDMVARLTGMNHAIPNNVIVADPREAFVAELGTQRSHVRRGADGVLAVTNDFLEHPVRFEAARCPRFDALTAQAAKNAGRMTVETMKEALFAAARRDMNIQATVCEPAAMRMHVSINQKPASAGPYVTLDVAGMLAK